MEKKMRFGDLVRNSGKPQVVTLWTKPEENPELTKAIKQRRVLTVIQEPGKTDYGVFGLELRPGALILVFPRPLPPMENTRVIGINFELVEQPVVSPAKAKPVIKAVESARKGKTSITSEPRLKPEPPRKPETPKSVPPKPTTRKFKVTVRRTASLESELEVEAANENAATRQAVEAVKQTPFELSQASVRVEVVKTE